MTLHHSDFAAPAEIEQVEPSEALPLWRDPVVYLLVGLILGFAHGRFW